MTLRIYALNALGLLVGLAAYGAVLFSHPGAGLSATRFAVACAVLALGPVAGFLITLALVTRQPQED